VKDCRGYGTANKLINEVLDPGLCSGCGACVGYCPYIRSFGERVAVIHECKICEGACYRVCPRTHTQFEVLRQKTFGSLETDPVLGAHDAVYFARACDETIRSRGQYGGVVTALSIFALNLGFFECALMTGGNYTSAKPLMNSSAGDILECAGSKYTASPTLSLFQEAIKKGYKNIGVIGRPCQVTAARKMQQVAEINGERISFIIGLFCMESFSPEFYQFIKERQLDKYEKMDIPGNVQFSGAKGKVDIPFEDIRKFIRKSCLVCYDPLSELADISVGSTEYDYGWNTLIIRTSKGSNLVREAVESSIIKIKPYPEELLPLLRKAVFNKKRRVLERADASYLDLPAGEREFFIAAGGDV